MISGKRQVSSEMAMPGIAVKLWQESCAEFYWIYCD